MKIAASPHLAPAIAFTGVCTLLGIAGIALRASQVPSTQVPSIAVADPIEPVRIAAAAQAQQPAPPPAPSSQLLFTLAAGGSQWVRLTDLDDADAIAHGKRKLYGDGVTVTVASVKASAVPARFRRWAGEAVTIYETSPGGTCTGHVTGFAVITQLSGDPGYAGIEAETWDADSAAGAGAAVLAARVEGCKVGLFAREAKLAPIVVPAELPIDAKVAREARAALLASKAAADARSQWQEYRSYVPTSIDWTDQTEFVTKVVRHPTTGVTWVVVHAQGSHECGGLDVNIVGLFQLRADGTLVTVDVRKLDTIYAIDKLIDIDNDGTLELIGKNWLGTDEVLGRPNNEIIDSLTMPFHGCPC